MAQILTHLDRRRFEPVLLTAGEGWLTLEARRLEVRVHPLKHLVRPIRPLRDLLALVEILRVLRSERPDVLHLHSSKAGILGRLAGRLAGVPRVLFTAHGFSFHQRLSRPALAATVTLERMLAPLADAIVPVSRYDHDRALAFRLCAPERLVVVENGVDTRRFDGKERKKARELLGAADDRLLVGTVARFAFPKDHALLLRAVAPLLLERDDLQLVLVGSGPGQGAAVELALSLSLGDRVAFLGDREDVPELLAGLDLFVLASRFEAMPMTVLEAMASGLPVVASRVGGVPELVEEGITGLTVPADDEVALREAIAGLLADAGRRTAMGEAGRRRAMDRFELRRTIRRLEGLYAPDLDRVPEPLPE